MRAQNCIERGDFIVHFLQCQSRFEIIGGSFFGPRSQTWAPWLQRRPFGAPLVCWLFRNSGLLFRVSTKLLFFKLTWTKRCSLVKGIQAQNKARSEYISGSHSWRRVWPVLDSRFGKGWKNITFPECSYWNKTSCSTVQSLIYCDINYLENEHFLSSLRPTSQPRSFSNLCVVSCDQTGNVWYFSQVSRWIMLNFSRNHRRRIWRTDKSRYYRAWLNFDCIFTCFNIKKYDSASQ